MSGDPSIVPARSADPAEVRALVARDGAGILTGNGPTEEDARAAVRAVLGADHVLALPEAAAVREGGDKDPKPYGIQDALPLHTDGFGYGDLAPDHFGLSCVRQGDSGGASLLVDAYRLLDGLDDDLRGFLLDTVVDHSEPGMKPTASLSPLALATAHGRLAVRKVPFVAPAPGADEAERARVLALVGRWDEAVRACFGTTQRFVLQPGDVAVIDNYRVLHARDPFTGERFMWRVWAWTDRGNGVPSGMLHSDTRYAQEAAG